MARLNSDGSVDGNFDPKPSSNVLSIATLANGQIIVGGSFGTIGGSGGFIRNRLAKLNSDGTVDASYNPNVNAAVEVVAVQADGKILIGGSFSEVGGVARNRIARINIDGSLDLSFNPDSNGRVDTIALTPNGDILIGGGSTNAGPHQKRLACGLTG
ncbi:MAG: putative delta-60 repeat protein [Arenicella sp.]